MSSSRVSNLIVGQREKEQSTIQPQSLREKQDEHLIVQGEYLVSAGSYLCDMCSTCIANTIKCQVE